MTEIVDVDDVGYHGAIYKSYTDKKKYHILGILDIKKMIPVPDGYYQKIYFKSLENRKYATLLKKEYSFCLSASEKIKETVEKLYLDQKVSGCVLHANCNFTKLEKAMNDWIE